MANSQTTNKAQSKYSEQYILNDIYEKLIHAIGVYNVGWNGQQGEVNTADSLALRIEYDSSSNPLYIGVAAPGTTTDQAFWQITKLTFDSGGNVTAIRYANGSPTFDQIYDNRSSLTYV